MLYRAAVGGSPVASSAFARLALLATGGAGELTPTRVGYLDNLTQFGATGTQRIGFTGIPLIYPTAATGIVITGGNPAWSDGAYSIVVAANVLTGHALVGYSIKQINVNAQFHFDIAEGAPAAEVVKFRAVWTAQNTDSQDETIWLPRPVYTTPNAAISVRARTSNAANTFAIWLIYQPVPLA